MLPLWSVSAELCCMGVLTTRLKSPHVPIVCRVHGLDWERDLDDLLFLVLGAVLCGCF